MDRIQNALKLNTTFARIEFWAFTTIFVFVMFFFIVDGFDGPSASENAPYRSFFEKAGLVYDFYKNFFIPQLIINVSIFLAFMCLNFIIVPQLFSKQRLGLNIVLVIFVFFVLGVVFGVTDYYLRQFFYVDPNEQESTIEIMFQEGFENTFIVFVLFSIYTIIKYLSLYLLAVSGKLEAKFKFIRREGIVATFIGLIILLLLISADAPGLAIAGWVIATPSAILLYLAGFYTLIPTSLNKKYPFITYAFKNALILLLVLLAWGVILRLVVGGVLRGDMAPLAALWIFNSVLQMFVTVPITWLLYKKKMKGDEQLNVLKKELGQSNANFDFLRSQINPHFLFNALNTIYGTALQEGAERTSEAVQKLGDMMRFMLQENMQEKISLSREIDYLNNYISLQRLRTDSNPNVSIETNIQDRETFFQIAPMLLIPFVENAFKHGISFREPSHIKITLQIKDNTVYFDVYNIKHNRPENDPEKDKSGIGLENVSQRLQLLYPLKHELVISDTEKEFYVHLTI
ncbi:MAG: sensor histidine kinase, partial [Flavisolibacter sp.]